MGARITLCGPPQLVPRELTQLPGTDGVSQIEPDFDLAEVDPVGVVRNELRAGILDQQDFEFGHVFLRWRYFAVQT